MNKLSWAENTYCNDFLDRSSIYPKSAETPSLNIKRYVQRYPLTEMCNWNSRFWILSKFSRNIPHIILYTKVLIAVYACLHARGKLKYVPSPWEGHNFSLNRLKSLHLFEETWSCCLLWNVCWVCSRIKDYPSQAALFRAQDR